MSQGVDDGNDGSAVKQAVKPSYADIALNLSDPVYSGVYYGKKVHDDDTEHVLARAKEVGCTKIMVTGTDLIESRKAVELAIRHPGLCYATVGVHPCSAGTFDSYPDGPDAMLTALHDLAVKARDAGQAMAFGEIGLDYDRLEHCPREIQQKYFRMQLQVAVKLDMPLFLHSRAASTDFEVMLQEFLPDLPKRGCVHSFTGSLDEMSRLVDMGFDIGVNGCSLKTAENLEVVKEIPLDRLQLETDGPWCEIRPSHASAVHLEGAPEMKAVKKEKWHTDHMVKGRNEPCAIARVAHVVARVKGVSIETVREAAWANSTKMFGLGVR